MQPKRVRTKAERDKNSFGICGQKMTDGTNATGFKIS